MSKLTKIIVLITLGLIAISCGPEKQSKETREEFISGGPKKWSKETREEFISGCVQTATITTGNEAKSIIYCSCALEEMQEKYDEETYRKEEVKMYLGNASSEFMDYYVDTASDCAAEIK